jgi:hypothetical protein
MNPGLLNHKVELLTTKSKGWNYGGKYYTELNLTQTPFCNISTPITTAID